MSLSIHCDNCGASEVVIADHPTPPGWHVAREASGVRSFTCGPCRAKPPRPPPALLHCTTCPRISPDTPEYRALFHVVEGQPVQCGICFADANPDSPGAQTLIVLDEGGLACSKK